MQLNSKQIDRLMKFLTDGYESILQADEFVKNFNSLSEFRVWARQGSIKDLQEAIKVFEAYELYEHCAVMMQIIDEK